jgi:ABC-type sugar transport system permease subunit
METITPKTRWRPARLRLGLRERLTGYATVLPVVVPLLLLIGFPVVFSLWLGFFHKHAFLGQRTFVGVENYLRTAQDPSSGGASGWGSLSPSARSLSSSFSASPPRCSSTGSSAAGASCAGSSCSPTWCRPS